MELKDYRELIKRYNPPKVSRYHFNYAVNRYAELLQFNKLSVTQTIVQLYKDKRLGLVGLDLERPRKEFFSRHTERSLEPEVFFQPNLSIAWVLAGIAVLGLVARLIKDHI